MPIHAGFLTLIVRFSGISLKIDGKLPGLGFAISSVLSSVPCLDLFGFKVGVLFFHFQLSQSPSLWHLSFKVYSILCNIDRMRQVDLSSLHLHSFLSEPLRGIEILVLIRRERRAPHQGCSPTRHRRLLTFMCFSCVSCFRPCASRALSRRFIYFGYILCE